MSTHVEARRGVYYDSVTLMRVSRQLSARAEVSHALTAMATELNRDLLTQMGFDPPQDVGPGDLLVAIRAVDQTVLADAREALDVLLTDASSAKVSAQGLGTVPPARTIGSAAGRIDATLALVSVPGPYAFMEAMDALTAGLSVMIFSDNMPVEEEVALKDAAARLDLLVMGPDCGTAVVGGAGLGFANAVRPGPVGLVAASGTGSQQLMSLLDTAGVGISHALGVGGRDLSATVSGRSTLQALAALDADPATELIIIVSKPPSQRVAGLIREAVRRLSTPVLFALLEQDEDDLTAVAERALRALGRPVPAWPHWPAPVAQAPAPGFVRGLFAGGTLCEEAMLIATDALGPIGSNLRRTATGEPAWTHGQASTGHCMIDFGADEFTAGRAHPMIDPALRLERLAAEAADPSCAVLLLDVVLGYGAEPDPAALLAPAIEDALASRDGDLAVVVSLCGTAADPQDRDAQAAALRDAGAAVFCSNATAARHAAGLVQGP
ncbi:FdrA family protein [Actinomadura alba]|uniref:FdrA family protein n=1 Tax=Actinomadura alba TaxID=406431 RepID=A0ABR7LL03_9ACTN|nr:FdrA family protein [Actinomadura alba]MBC6465488.1 FdrA family protein [Actinomadura alba]